MGIKEAVAHIQNSIGFEHGLPFISGQADELESHPLLAIEEYGLVSLPVTEHSVKKLRKYFSQSKYGKGSETLLDTSVRNSLDLPANKFSFQNSKWNKGIAQFASKKSKLLGVKHPEYVFAIPYKLLLYEPGSFFLPHRDTEKEKGMFATLIVQFPSVFRGGNLLMHFEQGKPPHVCDMELKEKLENLNCISQCIMLTYFMKSPLWNLDIDWQWFTIFVCFIHVKHPLN
jgi:hypothetical protein